MGGKQSNLCSSESCNDGAECLADPSCFSDHVDFQSHRACQADGAVSSLPAGVAIAASIDEQPHDSRKIAVVAQDESPAAADAFGASQKNHPIVKDQEDERRHLKRLFIDFVTDAREGKCIVTVVDPPSHSGSAYDAFYSVDGRLRTFSLSPKIETQAPARSFELLHLDTAWRASEFPRYWDEVVGQDPAVAQRQPAVDRARICVLDYSNAASSERPTERLCLVECDALRAERLVEAMTLLRLYNEDAGW